MVRKTEELRLRVTPETKKKFYEKLYEFKMKYAKMGKKTTVDDFLNYLLAAKIEAI